MAEPSSGDESALDVFDEALRALERTDDLDALALWCRQIVATSLFVGVEYARWSYPVAGRAPDFRLTAGVVGEDAADFGQRFDPREDPGPRMRFRPDGSVGAADALLHLPERRRWVGRLRLALAVSERTWRARPYDWAGRVLLLGVMLQHRVALWRLEERPPLGRREIQCLAFAAEGYKAKQIAAALGIGQQTVQFHLARAREKLACGNTVQAVVRAARLGLLSDPGGGEADASR